MFTIFLPSHTNIICQKNNASWTASHIWTLEYFLKNKYLLSIYYAPSPILRGFPGGSEVKTSLCNAGDPGSIPGSGRSPGEGNGNPLQYSCLENLIEEGAWWAPVHGITKSWKRLSFSSPFSSPFLSLFKSYP